MADSRERVFEIIVVFGIILLAAVFIYFFSKPAELPEEKLYLCAQDSDCTLVKAGCCGCNAGGNKTSINQAYVDYWNKKLDRTCRDTGCPAVISNDISCSSEARCVKNKCSLVGLL